jgi:hypothetical protein
MGFLMFVVLGRDGLVEVGRQVGLVLAALFARRFVVSALGRGKGGGMRVRTLVAVSVAVVLP